MKVGVVGAVKIDGLLGTLWKRAGQKVFFASRQPELLSDLAQATGTSPRSGTPEQAIEFGEVVFLSMPARKK